MFAWRYLNFTTSRTLLARVPAQEPGEPPEGLAPAISWFHRYLRYRQWEVIHGGDREHRRVKEISRKFGIWYLHWYTRAGVGGDEAAFLSWVRAASLPREESGSHVILMIVLDGLRYDDAESVLNYVEEESERLELDSREVVLSTLPTITRFAKPALVEGAQPKRAIDEAEREGSIEREESKVLAALTEAEPGDMIIWGLEEPDKTYHSSQSEDAIRREVQLRLRSSAQRIAAMAERVPDHKELRVIVTTDHGRLLGSSERAHHIPSGMKAEGRAAWGEVDRKFPEEGIIVEGDLAYLDAGAFGLPQHCAVVLSDDAFRTSSGQGGITSFAHGGLYPEEVFIPWLEFTRDRSLPNLEVSLAGSGVAGAGGEMMLSIRNLGRVAVKVMNLETSLGGSPEVAQEFSYLQAGQISIP